MGVLFIVALLLAWPTFGLSLIVWVVIAFFNIKKKEYNNNQRKVISEIISPLFKERYGEFYKSLDIPYVLFDYGPESDAIKCGRHIVNYISHNPEEAAQFIEGLKFWTLKGSSSLCDPIEAAKCEVGQNIKRHIHLVSYRAIEALMMHNNLPCFNSVDLPRLKQYIDAIEAREVISSVQSHQRKTPPHR